MAAARRLRALASWRGRLGRAPYAAVGTVLVLVKFGLDRLLAAAFDRRWGYADYWSPSAYAFDDLPRAQWAFYAALAGLVLQALMGLEASTAPPPTVRPVTTSIVVDAPPPAVWKRVIAFPSLDPPREALFRAGIAYPVGASIDGSGVGAVRRCVFSTGAFVEPITVWDAPRRLAFSVAEQPASLEELSPWGEVRPPHLDGFLRSRRGEFRLEPLPGGRTRLTGTTWYENRMWPASYWRAWSDEIMHAIHRRVLEHVARTAEADGA